MSLDKIAEKGTRPLIMSIMKAGFEDDLSKNIQVLLATILTFSGSSMLRYRPGSTVEPRRAIPCHDLLNDVFGDKLLIDDGQLSRLGQLAPGTAVPQNIPEKAMRPSHLSLLAILTFSSAYVA